MKTSVGALLTTAVTTILIGCGNDASDPDLVARAGEYRLTVDDVVELLEDEESLPAQAAVVESLVDLWIDYTLLADAAVEDTLFSDLDLIPLVRQQVDREMVFQLRDSVIQVDTFITPEELRNLYTSQAPEVEIRARHIMLTLPFEATGEQRDSVRLVLEGLRERIITGARFEDVARAFSQDPGSSQSGGDLGFFMRGDMVLPFEEAALALEPGELSEVVETPMGLHLIRVEERRVQDFEEAAPAFRARVQAERTTAAESTFVAGLEGRSPPRTTEGAYEVVRELARNPGTRVTGRAARRALVEWDGGAYEVRDLQDLLQFEQPLMRQQVAASTDEDLETFLLGLARRTLLIAEARRSGLEPPRARLDSLTEGVRSQLLGVARSLGLTDLDQAPGEEREIAIARAVRQALADNLAGATPVVPLGLVGFQLREGVPVTIFAAGVGRSVIGIASVRAERGLSPLEESFDTTGLVPDSAGP